MEQQNNTAILNDVAGVLPMDTGVTVNGVHDGTENKSSSSSPTTNAGVKKGRGRPPKSAGSTKSITVSFDTPKRGRGRPAKAAEAAPVSKKVVVAKAEEAPTNGNVNGRKRGRPSKGSTPHEQINGISKPQVQPTPVSNHQEQENNDEQGKRKRGRPPSASPKKAIVAAPKKKRGRPSGGSARGKKPAVKPKASVTHNGSAKQRGRPKKAVASSAAATPVNETTATITPTTAQ